MGASTHHQDQSMTLHNFNTTNAIQSNPQNPTPSEVVFVDPTSILIVIVLRVNYPFKHRYDVTITTIRLVLFTLCI